MNNRLIVSLTLATIALTACSSGGDKVAADSGAAASSAGDTSVGTPAAAHEMSGMEGMASMTGDPDRDFLRMMSDHHKGMLLMTETVQSRGVTVKDEAKRMATAQDAEIERMRGILKARYSDSYAPASMADAKTMVGELTALTGSAFDRKFYQHTIHHHQAAVKMIDEYLPSSKQSEVKAMAEAMKAAQQKEITEFEGKLAAL